MHLTKIILLFVLCLVFTSCLNHGASSKVEKTITEETTTSNVQIKYTYVEVLDPVETELVYSNTSNLDHSTKPYMDISKITSQTSNQWKYLTSLECVEINAQGVLSVTNDTGYVVSESGAYGVAMGSYWGDIGTEYKITLDTGIYLNVVKVDEKQDIHTDTSNMYGLVFGDIIEFVIDSDTPYMQSKLTFTKYDETFCESNGMPYNGSFNNTEQFNGNILTIERIITE